MSLRVLAALVVVAAATACSSADRGSAGYSIADEIETGIGTEVVVTLEEGTDPAEAFDAVLDDHDDYAAVYVVCAGDDLRQDGFVLYGRADGDDRSVVIDDGDC